MPRERTSRLQTWGRWALLAGLVLLVAGFVVRDIRARTMLGADRIAFGLMIGGCVLALGGALLDIRTFVGILRGRRTMEGVNFAVVVLLFLTLAGLLCYISTRWFARMDWTGKRTYSLHSKTRNILSSLDRDVEAILVHAPATTTVEQHAVGMALDMLEEFETVGGRFSVHKLDWTTPKGRQEVQELIQRMEGEEPPRLCVAFLTDELHEIVPLEGLFRMSRTGVEFTGEDAFASALAKLSEDRKAAVYFLTGHGERPFETAEPDPTSPLPTTGDDRPEYSLSHIARALRGDNYEVSELNLASEGAVPEDCAVLIIAGPRTPLPEPELRAVQAYLDERNGCVIALGDPTAVTIEQSNLNDLIAHYGLKLRPDALGFTDLPTQLGVFQQASVLVPADGLGRHAMTSDLEGYNISLPSACPIEVDESAAPAGGSVVKLLTSSKRSWGETDYRPGTDEAYEFNVERDVAPPLVMAALVAPRAPVASPMMPQPVPEAVGPKLLVVGSSRSFVNMEVEQSPVNRYFLMNAVNWMGGKLHMLGIPPKSFEMTEVKPTDAQLRAGRYVFMGILPACIIAVGVSVWLVRRKRR